MNKNQKINKITYLKIIVKMKYKSTLPLKKKLKLIKIKKSKKINNQN